MGLIYQQYIGRKIVRTAILMQGSAFINLELSVWSAQISCQVWHRLRKLESVSMHSAAQQIL